MKIWTCKIGEVEEERLASGADSPMRKAVEEAYVMLTGQEPDFIFSGWNGKLTEVERAVVDFPATTDAHVWAAEFCKRFVVHRESDGEEMHESLMIGWFANAIEYAQNLATK